MKIKSNGTALKEPHFSYSQTEFIRINSFIILLYSFSERTRLTCTERKLDFWIVRLDNLSPNPTRPTFLIQIQLQHTNWIGCNILLFAM